jgi:hypothetical protein
MISVEQPAKVRVVDFKLMDTILELGELVDEVMVLYRHKNS